MPTSRGGEGEGRGRVGEEGEGQEGGRGGEEGKGEEGDMETEEGKGRGPQGLVHTPMFEILKNTLPGDIPDVHI